MGVRITPHTSRSRGTGSARVAGSREFGFRVGQDMADEIVATAKKLNCSTSEAIRIRKIDRADREEQEMVLDTYLLALGEI